MPLHNLLKDPLPITHKTIPMTGHQILKPPRINPLHTLPEPLPITLTKHIPQHPLLPRRRPARILQASKKLRHPPRRGIHARFRILFRSREVEEEIRLDEGLGWFVEEDYLLVGVGIDVFVRELGVELVADFRGEFVFRGEDGGEGDYGHALVGGVCFCAFLGEAFGPDDV